MVTARHPVVYDRPQDDLTVQVHLDDGYWHRRAIKGERTACGTVIPRGTALLLRHEVYEGHVCRRGCFSPWELEQVDAAEVAQAVADYAEAAADARLLAIVPDDPDQG
jgi:hypothetical protein